MKNPYGPKRKQCRTCGEIKPIAKFRQKPHRAVCLACMYKEQQAYADSHRRLIRAINREYYARHAAKILKAAARDYRKNVHKHRARKALNTAVQRGDVIRKPCEHCGKKTVHGHHTDYSRPLDVVWLCPKCHALEHRRAA